MDDGPDDRSEPRPEPRRARRIPRRSPLRPRQPARPEGDAGDESTPVPGTSTERRARPPAEPAPWVREFKRSPTLTLLTGYGAILIVLVAVGVLPVDFLVPGVALLAVVGYGEIRPILAERRLARVGRVVPGVVTAMTPRRRIRKHKHEATWTMDYRFSFEGRTMDGRTRGLPYAVVHGIEVGDPLPIHVDPDRPERNAWIGGG